MFDIVNITQDQKIDLTDAQRLGGTIFRASMDRYEQGIVGNGNWFRGFKMTDQGSGQLNVGNGEIYFVTDDGSTAYYFSQAGGQTIDLLSRAPAVNFTWAAIVASANPQLIDVRPTTYLTDSTTRATTGRDSPRLDSRLAKVDVILGRNSADPQPPAASDIPAGNVVVGYVKLSPSGIVQYYANALSYLPSLSESRSRLDNTDQWRAQVGATIDALGTNIAALQGQVKNLPSTNFVLNMAQDLSRVKEQLKIPQVYTLYGSDHYLDETYTNTAAPDYLATIEEGIRFPPANQSDSQLGLLNIYDGGVTNVANMLYPKFTTKNSLESRDHDTTIICNQYQYQTVSVQQLSMTRERIRVGPWYITCSNWFWGMGGGTYNQLTGIFTLYDGESFEIYPDDRYAMAGVTSWATSTHLPIRIRQVWFDGLTDTPYTDTILTNNSVSGAIHGNTFLCPQDGWLPQINLYFADKAQSGDITVLMLQLPSNGQPDFTKVIGTATIAAADIQISTAANPVATGAHFTPYLAMQKGQRYAFAIVTSGAHTMWMSDGNKLANGSHFVCTDGQWAIGDLTKDLCFDLVFCQFASPNVEVQLLPLNLDGGICQIDMLAQMYSPSGTNIAFMAQVNGQWTDILNYAGDTSPLNGLPPLLPFKAVFTGTTDMMPALGVASNSRVTCSRPRATFLHLSDTKVLPPATTTKAITVTTRLEGWRGAPHHTHGVKLRSGAGYTTITSPTAVNDVVAPDDPNALIRTSVFSYGTGISSFIIEQDGTTDSVVSTFHVAEGDYVCS